MATGTDVMVHTLHVMVRIVMVRIVMVPIQPWAQEEKDHATLMVVIHQLPGGGGPRTTNDGMMNTTDPSLRGAGVTRTGEGPVPTSGEMRIWKGSVAGETSACQAPKLVVADTEGGLMAGALRGMHKQPVVHFMAWR